MATVNKPVDVVIVGFGWTGAIMAIELAQAGLNVLALERGDDAATVPNWAYPKVVDEIAQSARNGLLQNLSRSTVTIRHSKNDRALPYRQIGSFKPGVGVGGAGIHWSGVHSRVMPEELRLKSRVIERYGVDFIPDDMSLHNQFIGSGGVGQAIEDFYGDNFDHGPLGFIGGGVIWGRQTGNGPVRGIPLPSGSPSWGSGWKAAVKENFLHTGRIESQSSNMAYRGCYLDLDPTYRDAYGTPLLRMTLNWQDNDMRVSEFLGGKLSQIGKAMGAKSMSGRVLKRGDNWDTRPYQSTHINGGTAMGADPKTSVVNKYLQSWDVPNLFVLGSNVFAHGIGYNPTGLVGGLAYWAAANIRSTYLKDPGPMVRL